jgi:type I restriction enzyme S subunit
MAQEIFKEWFVRFRFPGWQKIKFVDSELGKIPEGWKATILEEIMNLRREKFKSYNEWKNEKLLDLGRFPQKSLAINEHGKGEEIKTSAFKFYKGDILFGAVRPYFHKVVIAPFDGVTNQSVFVIFPKKQEFYSYLITILFSESTINYATNMAFGTKMPVLKYEDLANMNIVLPDFKILSIFNGIVDKFYKILIEKVEENQKLAALRDLLLPKLMSGEIRV